MNSAQNDQTFFTNEKGQTLLDRFKSTLTEVSYKILRRHLQQQGYERIYHGFAWARAKPGKILACCLLADQPPDVREGKMAPAIDLMSSGGCFLTTVSINPGERGCHHAEIQVVGDRHRISGLGLGTTKFLLQLFETSLDFPSGPIYLDDLGNRQGQIRREQGDPLRPAIHPDNPYRTPERLQHDNLIKGQDDSFFAVKIWV